MIRRVGVNLDKQYKNIQRMKRSPIPKSELDYGYDCDYVEESCGCDYNHNNIKSSNTYNSQDEYDNEECCCSEVNLKYCLYATLGVVAVAAITKMCVDSYNDRRRYHLF